MASASDMTLPEIDHTDPSLVGDRFHAEFTDLARRSWLARSSLGYVVLERQAVSDLLRDRRLVFPAVQLLELQGVRDGRIHERTRNGIMALNGEAHARLRRLVAPAFAPRAVERLRSRVEDLLADLWGEAAPKGHCDFVSAIATPLPSLTIAELLEASGDAERLAHWSGMLQAVFDLDLAGRRTAIERAYDEVQEYVLRLLRQRRRRPGPDLVSHLATAEVGGERLTDQECVSLVAAVIAGATDTTQAQLAHGMRLFIEHPDQWELLASDPDLAGPAAAEVLRFEPSTPFTARLVVEGLTYRGISFPAGTVLFACATTANRDPATYTDPDRFDIAAERGGAQPLTFGAGAHFCLGANLARIELEEAFAFLARRMRDPRYDGKPVFGPLGGIYRMKALPIRYSVDLLYWPQPSTYPAP
ncbi:MAG: cytochrome P450 [Streptosporangiaceae bacterium]